MTSLNNEIMAKKRTGDFAAVFSEYFPLFET